MQYAVLRGETKFHCPECGNLPHYKQMYTTAAGTIQHYLQCSDGKECRTQFKVNNKISKKIRKFFILHPPECFLYILYPESCEPASKQWCNEVRNRTQSSEYRSESVTP